MLTYDHVLKMSPSDIRAHYRPDGYFFRPGTMRFFGDKMSHFGVKTIDGERFLYRKPSAIVNVFGHRRRAGEELSTHWKVIITPCGQYVDLV